MFASPDRSRQSFNGYHLLNEVSTGGTLTSLFSILTLFTEDIKLSWSSPASESGDEGGEEDEEDEDLETDITVSSRPASENGLRRNKSRANSDVSQMADETLGKRVSSPDIIPSPISSVVTTINESEQSRLRSASTGTVHDTSKSIASGSEEAAASVTSTTSTSPLSQFTTVQSGMQDDIQSTAASAPASPRARSRGKSFHSHPKPKDSREKLPRKPKHGNTGAKAFKGTIARATTETTLAVIPAEAFRKLTRKFPKASGTVVQVVL